MDKNIIATIHPFMLGQEILVYNEKGECIHSFETTIDNVNNLIYTLCEEYDINKVTFIGGQIYSKKFKDEFAANKFGNRKIEVTIK